VIPPESPYGRTIEQPVIHHYAKSTAASTSTCDWSRAATCKPYWPTGHSSRRVRCASFNRSLPGRPNPTVESNRSDYKQGCLDAVQLTSRSLTTEVASWALSPTRLLGTKPPAELHTPASHNPRHTAVLAVSFTD
jgi:hypothetical protein